MKTVTKKTPVSHPISAEITLNSERFYHFSCLVDNGDDVKILAHDDPEDGMMTVYIACLNEDIAKAMEYGWA